MVVHSVAYQLCTAVVRTCLEIAMVSLAIGVFGGNKHRQRIRVDSSGIDLSSTLLNDCLELANPSHDVLVCSPICSAGPSGDGMTLTIKLPRR